MKTIHQLDDYTRYWFDVSVRWADARWDDVHKLLIMPLDRKYIGQHEAPPIIRDSVWYATGLLMRQQVGDVVRALATIEAVLNYQFDEPGAVYHGTFYRYVGEAHPLTENAVIWRDYDPNWREFICTVFIILLNDFNALLPDALQERMRYAIRLAAEGAYMRKVAAEYTNISLMSAFLLDFAGRHFGIEEWGDYAFGQANKIYRLFNRFKTFNEYNSPTYYGVDFYALALWREYGATSTYREFGATMEAELWRDLAQFYHAGMHNICGPYDRSYGMDMTDYLALLGLWIAAVVPIPHAPLPDVSHHFEHAADFFFMPLVALVGSRPPPDVLPYLTAFSDERTLERTIEPQRTATSWLSPSLMLGAEADHLNATRTDQFHPFTVHWVSDDGKINWIRSRTETLIQAVAKPHRLELSSPATPITYQFEVCVTNPEPDKIMVDIWQLPALTVRLDKTPTAFRVTSINGLMHIELEANGSITLTFEE